MNDIKIITFFKREDIRGVLIPIESYKDVPFNIERVFFIKNTDEHPRGFHAHMKTEQVLVPVSGSFKVELTDGKDMQTYNLTKDNEGLYFPVGIWLKMYDYSSDCIIFVICSYEYDEKEYIRNFGDFLKYRTRQEQSIKSIQRFDLQKQTKLIQKELYHSVKNVINNNAFVLGKDLQIFEDNFAKYIGAKFCVGCSNGTAAMVCALKALQLQPNDEVIVQSNTYIAAPLAIELCKLKIKIVDIDNTLHLDLDELEKNLTEKIKVVLIVHLYGGSADMGRLLELKRRYGFYLIEDAAQAHGSLYNGKKLGTFGELGCFSFYPSKNLGSFGEGGCITTNIEKYANYAKLYCNYGSKQKYVWEIKGSNERMHNIQAAVLNVKLQYLDYWNQQRNILAEIYNEQLSRISQITIPANNTKVYRNYHLYIILIENRDQLLEYLGEQNIHCAIHYPGTFYKSTAFQELNQLTFKADEYKKKLLSLPMYPELSIKKVNKVCDTIHEYYS